MFSTIGYFNKIPCPLEEECTLPTCIFLHAAHLTQRTADAAAEEQVSSKKRKTDNGPTAKEFSVPEGDVKGPGKNSKPFFGALLKEAKSKIPNGSQKDTKDPHEAQGPSQKPPHPSQRDNAGSNTTSAGIVTKPAKPIRREALNPRQLASAPVEHNTRVLYVKKLHEFMKPLNDQINTHADPETRSLGMGDEQLVTLVLDEEEQIAKEEKNLYSNMIKMRMIKYKKMSLEDWKLGRLEDRMKDEDPDRKTRQPQIRADRPIETGLSKSQEREILRHVLARQDGLEKHGYVTSPPTIEEIAKAKEGVEASGGWERCERCSAHFPVFPDRRLEDGALTDNGPCRFHHGRLHLPTLDAMERKAQQAYGQPMDKAYTCCRQEVGSPGCEECDSHVFKVYDCKRLASQLQFECTPDNPNVELDHAVAFDCEMCFTVHGMELLRLTALSWPTGEKLLDVLVRPLGSILDLNSRYSGVHPEDYVHALPYEVHCESNGTHAAEAQKKELTSNGPTLENSLPIVDSPKIARKLLFDLLTPSTPLLGHAIENDLNAVRIVHPCIVDTALLYPHQAGGLPYRRSLKSLTKQYLWRDIQIAGSDGHDSTEDAKATGDLVREKVKRKWWDMKRNGWTLSEDGKFVPPDVPTGAPSHPSKQNDIGHQDEERGQKRHYDDMRTVDVEMVYD